MAKNISHDTTIWQITSVKTSNGSKPIVTTTSVTSNTQKVGQTYSKIQYMAYPPIFGKKFKTRIIKNNIPHTPTKVGVMVRKTFSHTPDEAMSGGLVKACEP